MYKRNHPCGSAISPKGKHPSCGLACGSREVAGEFSLHIEQRKRNKGDHFVSYVTGARESENVHSICFVVWGRPYKVTPEKYFPQHMVRCHGWWNDGTRSPTSKGSLDSCPHTCQHQDTWWRNVQECWLVITESRILVLYITPPFKAFVIQGMS